jgi:hypothetical protein
MSQPVEDDFEPVNPVDVVPGYETDLDGTGIYRVVDPVLVAEEVDWSVHHPDLAAEVAEGETP